MIQNYDCDLVEGEVTVSITWNELVSFRYSLKQIQCVAADNDMEDRFAEERKRQNTAHRLTKIQALFIQAQL